VNPQGAALLDTSVVIGLTQEGRDLDLRRYSRLVVSSVTYAELRLGIARARKAEAAVSRDSAVEQISSLFGEGVPFDDRAALELGRILQTVVRQKGKPKSHVNDRVIALQ